jgi:hypothetical protein
MEQKVHGTRSPWNKKSMEQVEQEVRPIVKKFLAFLPSVLGGVAVQFTVLQVLSGY